MAETRKRRWLCSTSDNDRLFRRIRRHLVWIRYRVWQKTERLWADTHRANLSIYRTISGIIAMPWWLRQFSTGVLNDKGERIISPGQSSEIVSILSAGTFFGALSAAPIADHIGRRLSLMIAVAVFSFGVILQTASMDIPMFTAGR